MPQLELLGTFLWANIEKIAAAIVVLGAVTGYIKRNVIKRFFSGLFKRVDDRLRKHYIDEPETIDDAGFLPDRNQPHWEVHASEYYNQAVEVLGLPDGTGWAFNIPIWVRNVGFKLTPQFSLEIHSPTPYVLREVRDWNANIITESTRSPESDKHRMWWMVSMKHLTPVSLTPVLLGFLHVTIHGARVPPVLELKWRVALSGKRYYPTNSYGWFLANLKAVTPKSPELPEQPLMPGETLEAE